MILPNVVAVIVHHRSYDTLPDTVSRLIAEGISPSNIVVIDNSEDPENEARVESSLPAAVNLLFTSNSGYGAAVNQGVRWHAKNTGHTDFVLVSTHESLPEPGAVHELQIALEECPQAAVAGPALVTGRESETIWSAGGYFSSVLGLPLHRHHKATRAELPSHGYQTVDWADGAFLMFRRFVIEENPIDEKFFLYMEETDHQQGLRRLGWKVIIQQSAVVWQSSGGVPPYYQTRNIQLFHHKNGTKLQKVASPPYILARSVARDLVKGRGTAQWARLLAGWRDGAAVNRKYETITHREIAIVNPLGGALSHYTKALATLLRASGARVLVLSIDEPSVSGRGRARWLLGYLDLLLKAGSFGYGSGRTQTLVTWPVMGFLDLLLVRAISGKSSAIVYHDPKPLVRSIGNGRAVARLASLFPSRPRVVVHSTAAADAMHELGLGADLDILAHPMLPPATSGAESKSSGERPVIRVLGQFKQDRDLEVLRNLATQFSSECDLEIVGRGWPAVNGWNVDSRFVAEQELDELVRSSDAIVIPYKRFYQSGIAIRALEAGTPIVGRAATSLADLYGADSRLLVTEPSGDDDGVGQSWSAALQHAIRDGKREAHEAANSVFESVVSDWRGWTVKSPASSVRK